MITAHTNECIAFIIKVKMKSFNKVIEQISSTIGFEVKLPELSELSTSKPTPDKRHNEDRLGSIAGKYMKGMDNTEGSMVTDRDRKATKQKEQIKKQNETSTTGTVMSGIKFDKLFGSAGGRSLNLSLDEDAVINSKDKHFTARLLPDGRVKVSRAEKPAMG